MLTVAPWAAKKMPGLFALNERTVLLGNWVHGFFSFTAVGAFNVGSIALSMEEVHIHILYYSSVRTNGIHSKNTHVHACTMSFKYCILLKMSLPPPLFSCTHGSNWEGSLFSNMCNWPWTQAPTSSRQPYLWAFLCLHNTHLAIYRICSRSKPPMLKLGTSASCSQLPGSTIVAKVNSQGHRQHQRIFWAYLYAFGHGI